MNCLHAGGLAGWPRGSESTFSNPPRHSPARKAPAEADSQAQAAVAVWEENASLTVNELSFHVSAKGAFDTPSGNFQTSFGHNDCCSLSFCVLLLRVQLSERPKNSYWIITVVVFFSFWLFGDAYTKWYRIRR